MSRIPTLAAACLLAASMPARPDDAALCARLCKGPGPVKGTQAVVIDANTARVVEGSTQLDEGTQVQIVFSAKNPFKYAYRFRVTSQPLDAATAAQFLGKIPALAAELPSGPTRLLADESTRPAPVCPAERAPIEKALVAPTAEDEAIAAALRGAQAYVKSFDAFFDLTSRDDAFDSACVESCVKAASLRGARKDRDLVAGLAGRVSKLQADVAAAGRLLAAVKEPCLSKLKTDPDVGGRIDALEKSAKGYQPPLDEVNAALAKSKDDIATMDRLLDSVLQDDKAFREARYPQTASEPTGVHVEIQRRALRVKDAQEEMVGAVDLRVGHGFLSLSAGVMGSTLDHRKVVRQSTSVLDANGQETTGLVFGYETNSVASVAPVLLLTANLCDMGKARSASFGLSLGIVAGAAAGGAAIEYVSGVTFAFLHRRVFLTAGVHAGQREELANFYIGQPIPSDLTDPIPTTKAWKFGGALALSFGLQ